MQRRRKQLLQTVGSGDVPGFVRGWLMETNVSVTEASGAWQRQSENHTIHRALPALLGMGSSRQAVLWQAPSWQTSPCISPPPPGLAGKIINVPCALNNIDKPILYTSSVLESSGRAKGHKVRRCHHHKAAQSQARCHEVVQPAQRHVATPKPDGCEGWHLWAEAGDSEKCKCHMPLGKPLSNNMKSHQK